jgi:protease PrsW
MDRRAGIHRWAWIPVLATLVDTGNPNFLPSLILIGSAVIPATFLTYAAGRTSGWQVSGSVLAATALLGGVIGTVAAGWLEYDTLRQLGMAAMLGVGFIEETAKLLVPVVVLIVTWRRRGGPADGLMVGLASGMGFAVLETMGYAFVALVRSGGDLGAVEQTLLLRGLLSPAGHTAWTGLICAAIWQVAARPSGRAMLALLATYLAVVVLHAAWDTFSSLVGFLIVGAISTVWVLWRMRHTRVFRPPAHSATIGYPPMSRQQLS